MGISRTFEGASPVYNPAITFDTVRFGDSTNGLAYPDINGITPELGLFGPNLEFEVTMAPSWIVLIPGAQVTALTSTSKGEVILAGIISNDATFGKHRLHGKKYPHEAIFLAKYTSAGELVFAKKIGANVWPFVVACDTNANIVVGVQVLDRIPNPFTAKIGSRVLRQKRDAGALVGAVAAFNSRGKQKWAVEVDGTIVTLAVDNSGNYLVDGSFQGTTKFGKQTLTANGPSDAFLGKFDKRGQVVWVRCGGGRGEDSITEEAVGPRGEIFATGWAANPQGRSRVSPYTGAFGSSELSFNAIFDLFVAYYSPSGEVVRAVAAGGTAVAPIALSLSESNLTVFGLGDALTVRANPLEPYSPIFVADVNLETLALERGAYLTNSSVASAITLGENDVLVATDESTPQPRSVRRIARSGVLEAKLSITGDAYGLKIANGQDGSFYLVGELFGGASIGGTKIPSNGFQSVISRILVK